MINDEREPRSVCEPESIILQTHEYQSTNYIDTHTHAHCTHTTTQPHNYTTTTTTTTTY